MLNSLQMPLGRMRPIQDHQTARRAFRGPEEVYSRGDEIYP
jgi:hypothetical protein